MSTYNQFPYSGASRLVGRTLRSATIGPDDVLTFATDTDDVVWDVSGGCCSDSRFTDIKLDAVLGKRIAKAEEVESIVDPALDPASLRKFAYGSYETNYKAPEGFEEAPQESEQIYGIRITADDGAVGFVIHRNWSNGYYGGMLSERPA